MGFCCREPPTQLATKVVKSVTGLVPLKLNYETPVLGQVFSLRSRLGVDLRELSSITSAYGSLWSFIAIYGWACSCVVIGHLFCSAWSRIALHGHTDPHPYAPNGVQYVIWYGPVLIIIVLHDMFCSICSNAGSGNQIYESNQHI